MAFGTPKRSIPKPDLIGPHRTPSRQEVDGAEAAKIRRWVFRSIGMVAVLGAIGFAAYGPWWRITSVRVVGTRAIDPQSVARVANHELDGYRWLILPKRTSWVLSTHGLEQRLLAKIRERISVESVVVTQQQPHGLTITIAERIPVAVWSSGTILGSLDRHGVIIELRSTADTSLPNIIDDNAGTFTVDSSVVKQEVVSAITTLQGEFDRAKIPVKNYSIPVVTCLEPNPELSNTNATTTNTPAPSNRNTNAENSNTPVNTTAHVITPPCDAQALRFSSQEVHAQLVDGPKVLFDRQNDLAKAVATLQRVLAQQGATAYKSIDVRFGDRVFVK